MSDELTSAEAAILTPPPATVYGQPVPNTVMYWGAQVTRYSNPAENPDPTYDATMDAVFCAGQSAAKQGLYAGMPGAVNWNAPALSQEERSELCKALSDAGENIFMPVDLEGQPPSRAFYQASVQGLKSITAVTMASGSWQEDKDGFEFPVPEMQEKIYQGADGNDKLVRTFVLDTYPDGYPIEEWADEMLTVAPLPGVADPIGVYVGGLNIKGRVAEEGHVGSYYGVNNGDTRPTGSRWRGAKGVVYLKTLMPKGQGQTVPVIWMQISAGR